MPDRDRSGSRHQNASLRLPSFSELVESVSPFQVSPQEQEPSSLRGSSRPPPSSPDRAGPLPQAFLNEPNPPWRVPEGIPPLPSTSTPDLSMHSFETPLSLSHNRSVVAMQPAAAHGPTALATQSQLFQAPTQTVVAPSNPAFLTAVTIPYEPEPKTWVMPFDSVQSLDDLRDTTGKPRYPYPVLIRAAILSSPEQKLRLQEIYAAIENKYPYYKTAGEGWKNSIRHNLSLIKAFKKVARGQNEPGKGGYWTVSLSPQEPGPQRTRSRTRARAIASPGALEPAGDGSVQGIAMTTEPSASGSRDADRPMQHRFAPVLVGGEPNAYSSFPDLHTQLPPVPLAWGVAPSLPPSQYHSLPGPDSLFGPTHGPVGRRHSAPHTLSSGVQEGHTSGRQRADTMIHSYRRTRDPYTVAAYPGQDLPQNYAHNVLTPQQLPSPRFDSSINARLGALPEDQSVFSAGFSEHLPSETRSEDSGSIQRPNHPWT